MLSFASPNFFILSPFYLVLINSLLDTLDSKNGMSISKNATTSLVGTTDFGIR